MRTKQTKRPNENMRRPKTTQRAAANNKSSLTPPRSPKPSILEQLIEMDNLTPPRTPGRDWTPPPTPRTSPPTPEKTTISPEKTWKAKIQNGKLKITKQKPDKLMPKEIINNMKKRNKYIFQLSWPNKHTTWKEFHETAEEYPEQVRDYLEKQKKTCKRRYNDLLIKHPYLADC